MLFATHDRSLLEVRPRRLIVLDEGKAIDVPNGVATPEDDTTTSCRSRRGSRV